MNKFGITLLLLLILGAPAFGTSILMVGTNDEQTVAGFTVDPDNVLAVGWQITDRTFFNVTVSIRAFPNFGGGTYNAFLTDAIGNGVSTWNEWQASVPFSVQWDSVWIPLWQNITLIPGMYYLTVADAGLGTYDAWAVSNNQYTTVSALSGVTRGDGTAVQYWAGLGSIDPYAPASAFGPLDPVDWGDMMFDVTVVPEPATITLLGAALCALAILRRRQAA